MLLRRRADRIALASLAAVMVWFLVKKMVLASRPPGGVLSFDIYSFFFPTMIIAARDVLAGGKGLLWNPFHCTGQPFFADGTTGLLYPPSLLALFLPPDYALDGLLLFNLIVGVVSAYLLCRELRTGALAAWCGALAFALSNSNVDVISWTPLVSGPYAWLPAAMLFCERLLRAPTFRRAVALGVCIGFALIPGQPQVVLYLYQLIALRVLWELVTRRRAVGMRTLGFLALGLTLGPLFVAVQLLPTVEVLRASIRNADLSVNEISAWGYVTWQGLRDKITWLWEIDNPFLLMPWVLAPAALLGPAKRRLAVFYAGVAALSLLLTMGTNTPVFPLYMRLPLGTLFRDPIRFIWITAFCIAVLVALGVDTVMRWTRPGSPWIRRAGAAGTVVVAAVGYSFLSPIGLRQHDWIPIAIAGGALLVAALVPRLRLLGAAAIVVALLADLLILRLDPFRHLLPDSTVLFSEAPLFDALHRQMTSQDRVYLAPHPVNYALQQKTGSLFRVPVIFDYESLPSQRWASYFVMMRTGTPMRRLTDWGFIFGGWFPPGFNRRLLDLAAARYVVVAPEEDRTATIPGLPLHRLPIPGETRVYLNPTALPRAAWVPRIELVADPGALLQRLATGTDDLRQMALVEEAPSEFRGDAGEHDASAVEFATDDPEHIVLRVHAPRHGFLVLADQYYPGWRATVDGADTPIAHANFAFRVVEVPAGDSIVEFRYRPLSLALGALVSGVTVLGVAGLLIVSRRHAHAGVPATA